MTVAARSLYDVLGVTSSADGDTLRSAFRQRARVLHPDHGGDATDMQELHEAWTVLSDPTRRAAYDRELERTAPSSRPGSTTSTTPPPTDAPTAARRPAGSAVRRTSRRQAWVAGVQAQIIRLSRLAGRSATQTMLIRGPRADRAGYEAVVADIVTALASDTEPRLRAARAAGAAPLDLGVAATLVGIRLEAERIRRETTTADDEVLMRAELLDRMWDVLAHELPSGLTAQLGGNPDLARRLRRR